ncbi:hypothetical protein IMSHALPRED_005847 [Imshaugia aleurites]|uniref:Uncharacterized protein n=1 Tax=Imshaugia aleurites TaxID=172621 RepID=A0A8H3FJG3_9LECA|nr:hypothetical protein IMSHALPRED_005847 [Imshaugia aleurites]
MQSLLNSLKSTSLLLPLLILLTTLTNAYQINPRQISGNNVNTLACDTRTLLDTDPAKLASNWNITRTCAQEFQTTCSSSPGGESAVLMVSGLNPNELALSSSQLCDQGDFSNILPEVTPAICYCACKCTNVVQSMSTSSAAGVSTSVWSNYTATMTSSAPASSTTTSVRALGPQEGFERKGRV